MDEELKKELLEKLGSQSRDIFGPLPVDPPVNIEYPLVTRVEFIVNAGREQVVYGASNVSTSMQDDGRTLKVFLTVEDVKKILRRDHGRI